MQISRFVRSSQRCHVTEINLELPVRERNNSAFDSFDNIVDESFRGWQKERRTKRERWIRPEAAAYPCGSSRAFRRMRFTEINSARAEKLPVVWKVTADCHSTSLVILYSTWTRLRFSRFLPLNTRESQTSGVPSCKRKSITRPSDTHSNFSNNKFSLSRLALSPRIRDVFSTFGVVTSCTQRSRLRDKQKKKPRNRVRI